ncbi:hypothetical protein C1H46_008181 [Malus baccata]|uniref:Retrotransposon gag domain-containing protein n=1 Tax=Malus baccata TaxID=106549 RepID=A0A540N5C1_MALBA|nr:hypothetical protein C1H46_008181 [Malus baccata]
MALYNNNNAWMCKMFLSMLEGPTMGWFSELLARFIDCFESLADFSTNTYSMYRDVCKCHEAMFRMTPSLNDESFKT